MLLAPASCVAAVIVVLVVEVDGDIVDAVAVIANVIVEA